MQFYHTDPEPTQSAPIGNGPVAPLPDYPDPSED